MIRAVPADGVVMARIHAASFPAAEAWSADVMALQLGLPGVFGLLDDRGGLLLARVAADEAEILTLAVVPPARRQGRAEALLAQGIKIAGAAGAKAMFLEVSEHNPAAQGLYAKAGFSEVGRRPDYYADGSAAQVLRRAITCDATTGD